MTQRPRKLLVPAAVSAGLLASLAACAVGMDTSVSTEPAMTPAVYAFESSTESDRASTRTSVENAQEARSATPAPSSMEEAMQVPDDFVECASMSERGEMQSGNTKAPKYDGACLLPADDGAQTEV